MSEKIIELAKKVKALAEQGTAGEKAAAEGRLKFLMEKYGFTAEDIESEKVDWKYFYFERKCKVVMSQVIYKVVGSKAEIYHVRNKETTWAVKTTNAKKIEIEAMYDYYSRAYKKELEAFEDAFVYRNRLFAEDGEKVNMADLSEEEQERARKALRMMEGIDKSEYRKQLEGKRNE